jgi:hypothetical protein
MRDVSSWIRAVLGNKAMVAHISVRLSHTGQDPSRITILFTSPFAALAATLKLRRHKVNGSYLRPSKLKRAMVI